MPQILQTSLTVLQPLQQIAQEHLNIGIAVSIGILILIQDFNWSHDLYPVGRGLPRVVRPQDSAARDVSRDAPHDARDVARDVDGDGGDLHLDRGLVVRRGWEGVWDGDQSGDCGVWI